MLPQTTSLLDPRSFSRAEILARLIDIVIFECIRYNYHFSFDQKSELESKKI